MQKPLFDRTDIVGLLAIIVAALVLRIVAIDSQALWADEGQTIFLSLYPISEMFLRPTDPTPFLYYALHHIFLSPESSAVAIRSVSLVAGLLQLVPIYALGRLLFGRSGGLLAAGFLAVWTSHVDYSMEARAYSLFGLTTLIGFYGLVLFLRTAQAGGERGSILAGLSLFAVGCVLSFYTHMISVFAISAWSLLIIAFVVTRGRKWLREAAVTFAVMAVLALPGVVRALTQMEVGHDFNWLQQPGPATFVSTVADFFLPIGLWDNRLTNGLDIRLAAKAVFIGIFGLTIMAALWKNRAAIGAFVAADRFTSAAIAMFFVFPLVFWLAGYAVKPLFLGRTILFCIVGAILILVLLVRAQPERRRLAVSSLLLGIWLVSTLAYGMMREKEDWRGANRFLATAMAPDDILVVCPSFYYPALRHPVAGIHGRAALASNARTPDLTLLEPGLGASATWAQDYLASLHRFLPMPDTVLQLAPGQAIWRVDGVCWDGIAESEALDRLLAPIDAAPQALWSQKAKYDDHILIRRYAVREPRQITVKVAHGASDAGG